MLAWTTTSVTLMIQVARLLVLMLAAMVLVRVLDRQKNVKQK